ncbi:uncharacterized protein LOC110230087 [Arabidopsis lyrata subsp. lyrata]|uniref:uncharacterized protein LOC110230087 n=1 Tax=Arabidopsis lyrata subsp. lyrata TaxID=81972 RepID=UPI000A29C3F5|nr:uncharacterized protein LOC110230087 [Arabidopsis lyrata subsp. lyrata]|eukprot:XP_020887734.1 uncharacterized protein LOC110230087 [Arabidopsis lyrata subsp. lyrata]
MRLREGDGINTITTMLKQEYNISDVETRLKLTFRWPSWMLLVDDGTTRPQTIKTDKDMDLFLSMKVDVADLLLFVTRKNDAGVVTESPTLSNSADSDDDSGDSRRPDPWNERLDGLMSKKIYNLEVGSASTVPTYADEENTFFGIDLSMGVFGRDAALVLDNNIDGAREFPIVYIIEFVRKTLMTWFALRRETAKQEATMLTPKVREILQENFEKSGGFAVRKVNTGEYDVVGGAKGGYHVQLAMRSCTCMEFNFLKIPCPHAVAAAIVDQVPMHSLVDVHYTSCYWVMAYKDSINPVLALSSLHELPKDIASMNLLPLHTKRAPGRPKKKRFFSRGEFQKKGMRGQNVFSRCKAKGHNRATCRMPI